MLDTRSPVAAPDRVDDRHAGTSSGSLGLGQDKVGYLLFCVAFGKNRGQNRTKRDSFDRTGRTARAKAHARGAGL